MNILRRLFKRNRTSKNVIIQKNIHLGYRRLKRIIYWENSQNEDVIRTSFNRDLYYKYLKEIEA